MTPPKPPSKPLFGISIYSEEETAETLRYFGAVYRAPPRAGLHKGNGRQPMTDDPEIRRTSPSDAPALTALYGAAFPEEDLAPLVQRLHAEAPDILSLVAVIGGEVAGHILFTPCAVYGAHRRVALLGPLAVAPSRQRQGLGGMLIREGLAHLRPADLGQVLVLGDPAYYGRFGFRPERRIRPPYDLPAEWSDAWQSVLVEDDADAVSGVLHPPAPWLSPSLWAA